MSRWKQYIQKKYANNRRAAEQQDNGQHEDEDCEDERREGKRETVEDNERPLPVQAYVVKA